MKVLKYLFYKLKKVLFFFSFLVKLLNLIQYMGLDNYYDVILNDNMDDNIENKNKNMLITIIQVTYPFRKIFYGLVGIIIVNTFFDEINPDMVFTIITTIDIIDRSIVESLNELDEINTNTNSELVDNKEKDK